MAESNYTILSTNKKKSEWIEAEKRDYHDVWWYFLLPCRTNEYDMPYTICVKELLYGPFTIFIYAARQNPISVNNPSWHRRNRKKERERETEKSKIRRLILQCTFQRAPITILASMSFRTAQIPVFSTPICRHRKLSKNQFLVHCSTTISNSNSITYICFRWWNCMVSHHWQWAHSRNTIFAKISVFFPIAVVVFYIRNIFYCTQKPHSVEKKQIIRNSNFRLCKTQIRYHIPRHNFLLGLFFFDCSGFLGGIGNRKWWRAWK